MTLNPSLRTRLSRFLPVDLLNSLPEPQALATAIRRLSSLHQAIASFLPQYIADNERLYTEDYADLRPGTFLFADVSGFTALSERLQRQGGEEGIEILTRVINDFFARMLEILAKSNGQLLKFAGDALEAFFPASRNDNEAPLAIRTGLRMQREMRASFQPIQHPELTRLFGQHDLQLTMSIGICRGKLFEAVVGNEVQRDHIIQGGLPGHAMAAEEAGERDDVIITAAVRALTERHFETVEVAEGFFRVVDNFGDQLSDYEFAVPQRRRAQSTALFDLVEDHLLDDLERSLARLEGIARFVARQVVDRLAAGGGTIEPDNRPATVIFNHFSGFADLLEDWGEEQLPLIVSLLNRYYNLMQSTIVANGGTLTRTDPYRRGVKMLITFGAPVAHLDDPERAVTTALEMNRQLARFTARLHDELPEALRRPVYITQQLGITQGMVYAGEVGWKARREYTVMGDDVNLAARLMSKGQPGQILISERMYERVQAHFDTEALPPMQMKGKSQPVQAYLVRASTASVLSQSATSDTPLVGRDLQMLSMTYALQQAKGPRRRQAFAVIGETGVGKTRMAKQIAQAAESAGFQVAWANCQLRHAQEQSVWAGLLAQLLQIAQAKSLTAQRRLLHVRLTELGLQELEDALCLLLFGSTETERPAASPLQPADPAQPANSIFALANTEVDLSKSGVWGITRRQLQAALAAQSQPQSATTPRPFWHAVARRLDVEAAVLQFVQAYANHVPCLLVIDDLHLADSPTLNLLHCALEDIHKAQLMVLVTYEPTEAIDLPIRRKVNVGDLDQAETAQMAARFLGVGEIGPALRDLVWQRTSGRPLFIESLLRLLSEDGHIERSAGRAELHPQADVAALPDNVRAVIMSQIDHLSAEARAMLQVAAVLGDRFSAEALIGLVPEEISALRLEILLGELIHQEIVEALPDGTYRFRHGLTQTTVYESLNRVQRLKLHRAAAEWLGSQPNAERHVLRTAHQWVKAGIPTRGVEVVMAAAEHAESAGQFDRAIELYTHALDILPDPGLQAALERLKASQS